MLSRIIVFESLSRLFRGGINRRTLVVRPKQPWDTDSRGQTTPIARTRPEKLTFFCGSRLFIRSAGIPTLSVVLSLFRWMLVLDTEVNEFNACRVVFSTLPNVDGVNLANLSVNPAYRPLDKGCRLSSSSLPRWIEFCRRLIRILLLVFWTWAPVARDIDHSRRFVLWFTASTSFSSDLTGYNDEFMRQYRDSGKFVFYLVDVFLFGFLFIYNPSIFFS